MLIKLVLTGLWGSRWQHTGSYAFSDHPMKPETIRGALLCQGLPSRDVPKKGLRVLKKEGLGVKSSGLSRDQTVSILSGYSMKGSFKTKSYA